MNKITVSFETATYALKAKSILNRLGIKGRMVKLSGNKGCTHALEIDSQYIYTLVLRLKNSGINYKITDKNDDLL